MRRVNHDKVGMGQDKKLIEPAKRRRRDVLPAGRSLDQEQSAKPSLNITDAKSAVLRSGWLSEQDKAFQAVVLERATLRTFAVGSRVFDVGDFRGGIFGVAGGAFGIKVPRRGGDDRLAHICRGGVWFGYDASLSRRHRNLAFVAVEPSIAFHVPLVALDQIAASDPSYHRALTKVASHGMDIAIATVSDLLIPNVQQRIASTLLRIASTHDAGQEGTAVISGLTQEQIGELANAARDVVNRTLKRFASKGWIGVSYKRIRLLEPASLEAFCL